MKYSNVVRFLFVFSIFILTSIVAAVESDEAVNGKAACVRSVLKETVDELTEFSGRQLDALQNMTPETKKKVKTALMDVLSSLGLVLEVSTAPTISLGTLPVFILRAKHLFELLERDIEDLKPETESFSNSIDPIKNGVMTVIQGLPMKTFMCLYGSEL